MGQHFGEFWGYLLLASSGCKLTLSRDGNGTLCEVGQFPSSSEIMGNHPAGFVTKRIAGLWRYTYFLIHCVLWLCTESGNPVMLSAVHYCWNVIHLIHT